MYVASCVVGTGVLGIGFMGLSQNEWMVDEPIICKVGQINMPAL